MWNVYVCGRCKCFNFSRQWQFWQSSGSGATKGVTGAVDLDEWNGTLAELEAWAGFIADAGVVSGMTKLEILGLSGTRIGDLAPLVQNPGLGEGDEVNLRGLRIDSAFATSIAALEARGVRVLADPGP